jgi:hypothetical protein
MRYNGTVAPVMTPAGVKVAPSATFYYQGELPKEGMPSLDPALSRKAMGEAMRMSEMDTKARGEAMATLERAMNSRFSPEEWEKFQKAFQGSEQMNFDTHWGEQAGTTLYRKEKAKEEAVVGAQSVVTINKK